PKWRLGHQYPARVGVRVQHDAAVKRAALRIERNRWIAGRIVCMRCARSAENRVPVRVELVRPVIFGMILTLKERRSPIAPVLATVETEGETTVVEPNPVVVLTDDDVLRIRRIDLDDLFSLLAERTVLIH